MKDASKNIEDTVWTLIHNPVLNRAASNIDGGVRDKLWYLTTHNVKAHVKNRAIDSVLLNVQTHLKGQMKR